MKKNNGIQALRGCACTMVFLSHVIGVLPNGFRIFGVDLTNSPLRVIWGGEVAVVIFFFLSGFFAYNEAFELLPVQYLRTVGKRLLRLYPVYFITLGIGLAARASCPGYDHQTVSEWINQFWNNPISWNTFVCHLCLVAPFDEKMINPVIWTLRIEARMAFVLPIVMYCIKELPKPIVTTGILLGSYMIPYFKFLPVYYFGMVLRQKETENGNIPIAPQKNYLTLLLCILLLDIRYLFAWLGITFSEYFLMLLTTGGVWGVTLLILMNGWNPDNNILSYIGDVSYTFYLIHFIVILWFRFIVEKCGIIIFGFLCYAITLLLTVIIQPSGDLISEKFMKWCLGSQKVLY